MKRTDYERIAAIYDDAELRHDLPVDAALSARIAASGGTCRVVDVACGTGNYLRVQGEAHRGASIDWHGLDASEAMLARARQKLPSVDLRLGSAEALPYESDAFDYVSCNFAFHHFVDKRAALDELRRIVAPNGALRIANVAADRMPGWWVYRFFDEAWAEDLKRFWPVELLMHELEARGLEVRIDLHTVIRRRPAVELVREARGRDLSSVAIVDEPSFREGLAHLEGLAARGAMVRDELATLVCMATPR